MARRIRDAVEEEVEAFEYPTYTNQQLADIDKKLRARFFTKRVIRGKEVSLFDEMRFLSHVRAISPQGAVYVRRTGERSDGTNVYERPTRFEKAQDMLRQWREYVGRRDFAIKKETESVEDLKRADKVVEVIEPEAVEDVPF